MNLPNVPIEAHTDSFLDALAEVATPVAARPKLIHDAEIVALMNEHGVTRIVTADRDFLRFPDIEVTLVES